MPALPAPTQPGQQQPAVSRTPHTVTGRWGSESISAADVAAIAEWEGLSVEDVVAALEREIGGQLPAALRKELGL